MRFGSAIVGLLIGASLASAGDAPIKKVLLIGIDGCRTDALLAARAPHLKKLGQTGAMSVNNDVIGDRNTGADTVTLQGWTSMLTGVWADKHGVKDNGFTGRALKATLFSQLRSAQPKVSTIAFLSFRSLRDHVFDPGDDARFVLDGSNNGYDKADGEVADAAVKALTEKDHTLLFAYFGQVDVAGHMHGFHPKCAQYVDAIAAVDRHVGRILTALEKRPTYAAEDWLIIVGADHGGRGLGHTGGKSHDEVRRTFLILNGLSVVKENMPAKTANVDVAPTALTHLGVAVRAEWSFDGRCIGLKDR